MAPTAASRRDQIVHAPISQRSSPRPRFTLAILLLGTALCAAQPPDVLPPADHLLAQCIAALPDIPLRITGELQARPRDGEIEARRQVEMLLDWRAETPAARYTIRDAFGQALEHLAVTWPPGGEVEYRYLAGDPLTAAPLPELAQAIAGTDISWMDLSLSFLWWRNGRTVARDDVRGRACYVIDVAAPAGRFPGCAGVRLWIEPKIGIMLRAAAYGADHQVMRQMDVKGFKKINERWVIQHVEIESYPSRHKTLLRVQTVEDQRRKDFIKVDDGAEDVAEPDRAPPVTPVPLE